MTKLELESENHRLRLAITEAQKVWSFVKAKRILSQALTTSNLKRVVKACVIRPAKLTPLSG